MRSFNTIPLWKRVFGLITLAVAVWRVVLSVMAALGASPPLQAAGYGGEALAGIVIAIGLLDEKNRLVVAGVLAALAAILITAEGSHHPATMGHALVASALFAMLATIAREASQHLEDSSEDNMTRLLTAEQAQNFAEQKPELFGGFDPSDVSVYRREDGRWNVRLIDKNLETQPLTEPKWQKWLEHHHAQAA